MTPTRELALVPSNCCPTCGQKIREAKGRLCGACRKPIKRHHKFLFDGSEVRHRCCEEPESYTRSES